MAHCKTYNIDCPYSFESENAPVPCFGSQEECNEYRKLIYNDNSNENKGSSVIMKIKEMKE